MITKHNTCTKILSIVIWHQSFTILKLIFIPSWHCKFTSLREAWSGSDIHLGSQVIDLASGGESLGTPSRIIHRPVCIWLITSSNQVGFLKTKIQCITYFS